MKNIVERQRPLDRAKQFIRIYMSDNTRVKSKDIIGEAIKQNISKDTLTRAKQRMGIISKQVYGINGRTWYWVISNFDKYNYVKYKGGIK